MASTTIGLPEACLAIGLQIAPLPVVIATRELLGRQYSRRRGLAALDVCELHARLLALPISDELRAELCRWHVEPWFANRSGVKRPVSDEPPAGMLDELVAWLLRVLSAQS